MALNEVCSIGIEVLDARVRGVNLDASRVQMLLAKLAESAKPKAELLIQIVPGVKALLQGL